MKKILFFTILYFIGLTSTSAQIVKFGIKAGANFSNLDGIETKTKTSYHFGVVVDIKTSSKLHLQPEFLYSTQGAKTDIEGFKEINYDYIAVPVLVKLYLIEDTVCIEVGPQFAFLINDNNPLAEPSSYDFSAVGGLGIHVTKNIFIQGRYVFGLSDTTKNSNITNRVIQLSLGYTF